MKKIGIGLAVVLMVIAGAIYWLHGNLDGLVRDAIAKYGSEMTQAKVSVDGVKITMADGQGIISGLTIGNPKGFKTAYAFKVKEFTVAIDPASITGDVVTVKKIAIIAPHIIYEKGDAMTNFDAIQKNITDYIGPSDNKKSSGGKKLIVEELTIRGAKAEASAAFLANKSVEVDLPDLTLRNLGKAKGGVTPGELGQEIAGALKKQLTGSINFDKLGKALQEKAKGVVGNAAGDAIGKVKNLF